MYANIQGNTMLDNQNVKTIQMSLSGGMETQNVIHPHNGITCIYKKGQGTDTCSITGDLKNNYAK